MNNERGRIKEDPVIVKWRQLRAALQARSRLLNVIAAVTWVVLLIVTILDHWHAAFGLATVFFGLTLIIAIASPERDSEVTPGANRKLPDTAPLPELRRRMRRGGRSHARSDQAS